MKGTVGELGEFGLIRELTSRLTTTPAVRIGPGDDAAVVTAPDRRVVASTDILLEGRHFRRDWSTAYDVGRKAAAQNLADIAAMGAVPTAILLGLVVPAELPATWPTELMDGLRDECQVAGAAVVGGDVVRGDTITVAITALGDLRNQEPVTRAGAQPGDVVAVTGWLGWSAAGHAVLSRGFRSPRAFVEAHRRPEPPYHAGPAAAGLGATAMTDVSDGLVADLGHIAEASKVRIDLRSAGYRHPLADVRHRHGRGRGPDAVGAQRRRGPCDRGHFPARCEAARPVEGHRRGAQPLRAAPGDGGRRPVGQGRLGPLRGQRGHRIGPDGPRTTRVRAEPVRAPAGPRGAAE